MNRHILLPILLVIFLAVPYAGAQDLVIAQPNSSTNETRLAEMRDFYVYGIFNGTISNPGDVRIEVYPGDFVNGTPVRVVQSHVDPVSGITNESVIDSSYPNGSRWGGAMVPDLVKSPGDILDPANKVVVTSRYYLGLIQGGVTKNFDTSYKDSNGTLLTDLTAGNYTIEVTGLSGTCAGQKVNRTITLGITNAILGAFRPDSNKNSVIQYGITHDRRSYIDWFPGYFYDPDNPGSMGYRADQRWIPNNGIEIVNDRPGTLIDTTTVANNTMIIYNFNSGAATYYLELASILKYNLADSANTTFLYYDKGELVLTYNDSGGTPQKVTSALRQFSGSSRLALTHLDVRNPNGSSYENIFDPNDTAWKWVYTDLSGTISINQGQAFTIYGVTKPIPSTVSSTSIPYKYTIDNRTSHLVCNITDSYGSLVSTSTHEVNLSRYYNNYAGSSNPYQKFYSVFEFGSDFTTLTNPGTYTVTLTGTDVSGNTVTGAVSMIHVSVVPVSGTVGVFRNGSFFLSSNNTNSGGTVSAFNYGQAGDVPIAGDWSGSNMATVGIFRSGTFFLASSNTHGGGNVSYFNFGVEGDVPVAGKWSGTDNDTAGVFRNGTFFLASSNSNGGGTVNAFTFGQAGDIPVAGDWSGVGNYTAGVFRNGTFYLASSNTNGGGIVNAFNFGRAGDRPVAGDWNADGNTEVGVFREGILYLASSNTNGGGTVNAFSFGITGDVPVAGIWLK